MSETRTTGAPNTAAGFIGRTTELARLEAALEDARAGRPQLVLVSGESGVGKSRLLAEFRDKLPELGASAFGGECIDLGEDELPYAPLVAAIRPLVRSADPVLDELGKSARAEFARLIPELGDEGQQPGEREVPAEAQRRLFDALLALLYRRSEEQPVVFWIEDVHWADRSTRSFVSFLARSLREEKVLCVLTLRSDELHRRHPMRPLMAELARLPNAGVLELERFSEPELRDQLHSILGADPESGLVERMFKRSEGNPLFTEQLLAGGLDGRGGLPPTLRDALLLRLERLDETTQRVLRILSVVGSAEEETLAAATVGIEFDLARASIREAVAANLLDAEQDGRFRFRHALLREVVYDDLLPGERAEGHLQVARAIESATDGEPSAMRSASIAHHYNAAGVQDEAIRSAVVAARAEIHVHADAEAASLLERVLALWPRVTDPEGLTGKDYPEMLYWTGLVSFCAGDDLRAIALYEKAAEAMKDEPDPSRRAEVLGRLASLQWSQGVADRALATLDEALELAPEDAHSLRALLLAHRVRIALLRGKFADTIEFSGDALRELELSGPGGPQEIRINVLNRLGTALVALGRVEKGEEALRDAVKAGTGNPNYSDELGTAYGNYSDAMGLIGRYREAEDIARRGIVAMANGTRPDRWLHMQLSDVLFQMGRWSEAAETLPADPGVMTGMFRVCFDLYKGQLALGRGELETARELFDDAQELIRDSLEPQFISMLSALRAQLELAESDVPAAREVIRTALDRLEFCTEDELRFLVTSAAGVGVEAEAAQMARDLGSAEDESAAIDRAEWMMARVEAAGPQADEGDRIANPVSEALVLEAQAENARAKGADDAAERWTRAAQAWSSVGQPMQAGGAHYRSAEALLGAGDRGGAARALADAREVVAPVGPSLLSRELESFAARSRLAATEETASSSEGPPVERPFGLTVREMQVIALVAEGQTNREIAERLFMAEKTASVHVSRILAKLDVRSRTEAAAVAHRQGLAAPDFAPGD